MILYPAIDILDGGAVRLARGEFDQRTRYDADPLDAALRWVRAGARALHVVDLDGARAGAPANVEHVRRITAAVDVPVQVGGGLRSSEAIDAVLDAGAARVVLGTAAFDDVEFLDYVIASHGDRVTVSVDARGGLLAADGWTDQTEIPAESVIESLATRGVSRFVYSSIDRDGMMCGPDLDEVRRIASVVRGTFIYSGGVSSVADLTALASLRQVNLTGVIVGKALYEGSFDVSDGQAALDAAPAGPAHAGAVVMHYKRVIPCLDVDAGRVVKGVEFVDLRDAGDPVELAARYDRDGADEVVFLDITATSDKRGTVVELARRAADEVFVPLTIGGGIRSVADAQAVLDAGADKVSVNSAALQRPELLDELVGPLRCPVRGPGDRRQGR